MVKIVYHNIEHVRIEKGSVVVCDAITTTIVNKSSYSIIICSFALVRQKWLAYNTTVSPKMGLEPTTAEIKSPGLPTEIAMVDV